MITEKFSSESTTKLLRAFKNLLSNDTSPIKSYSKAKELLELSDLDLHKFQVDHPDDINNLIEYLFLKLDRSLNFKKFEDPERPDTMITVEIDWHHFVNRDVTLSILLGNGDQNHNRIDFVRDLYKDLLTDIIYQPSNYPEERSYVSYHMLKSLIEDYQYKLQSFKSIGGDKPVWMGSVSSFAVIQYDFHISGFTKVPQKKDGEINFTEWAGILLRQHDIKSTQASLAKLLNPDNDKHIKARGKMERHGYSIPNSKFFS